MFEETKFTLSNALNDAYNAIIKAKEAEINISTAELSNNDKLLVEQLSNTIKVMSFLVHTLENIKNNLGIERRERYFNVENGEVIEVDREHFKGVIDEEDEATIEGKPQS